MLLLSEGAPSYTNDDFSGSFLASYGNDSTFGGSHAWRTATAPVSNANDGLLTQTVYWVVDLSSVPLSSRQNVIFYWQNSATSGAYAPDLISNNPNNLLRDYSIQINFAPGGTAPVSGWSTVATVTGNHLHSKQHLVNMNGANWIGIFVTAVHGSSGNNNAQGKFKVFDAHLGATDSWKIFGDSITQRAFMDDEANSFGQIISKQIHGTYPGFYPLWEAAGIGGWTAQDIQPYFSTWLNDFPGKYVCLNFGTNDANLGGSYVTNYQSNMQNMISLALAAGKIVVIPTIPWLNTSSQAQANVTTLNGQIATLISSNPGCIAGPDLYSFFSTHQSDISNDGLHMTDPALGQGNGYVDYKTQWVNWADANIYHKVLSVQSAAQYKVRTVLETLLQSRFKVRTVLKTNVQSHFTIKLVKTGPVPYFVSGVSTKIVAKPYSTVSSQATVLDQNNIPQNTLNASVLVTYPDGTVANPTVYSIGNGTYEISYNTKGIGNMTELWTFSDNSGGQVEAQHMIACNY